MLKKTLKKSATILTLSMILAATLTLSTGNVGSGHTVCPEQGGQLTIQYV